MEKQRIIAHIWMWTIALAGAALAFVSFPQLMLFSPQNRMYLSIAIVPVVIISVYVLANSLYLRFRTSLASSGMEKIIKAGVYGRFIHPTCTGAAVLFWIVFIFYPDFRILVSNIWITLVVVFWIKLEEKTFLERKKRKSEEDFDVA